jgi:hypothetical protein
MQSSGDEADQQKDSHSAGNLFVTRRLAQERLLDGQASEPVGMASVSSGAVKEEHANCQRDEQHNGQQSTT